MKGKFTSSPTVHAALVTPAGQPRLAGHRGASAQAEENTLAAFGRAIELGVPMVEFDVRRTRDGVLVIHHDPKIQGRWWYALRRWGDLAPERRLRACRADFAAISRQLADWGLVRRLARGGWPVVIWTVDDDKRLRRHLADESVHMVISNLPPSTEVYLA